MKTVGTEPDLCATTTSISVPVGTTVYYCYTLTNVGVPGVGTHTLIDDKLGAIFTDPIPYGGIAPGSPSTGLIKGLSKGESVNTVELGLTVSAEAVGDVTNTATWVGGGYTQGSGGRVWWWSYSSLPASATVTVTPAVEVSPAFTG